MSDRAGVGPLIPRPTMRILPEVRALQSAATRACLCSGRPCTDGSHVDESFIATRRSLTRYRRPLGSSPMWAPSCIRRHRRWCQNWHQSDRPIHLWHSNGPMFIGDSPSGGVAERSNAAVLKTAEVARLPWVRIPPPPPLSCLGSSRRCDFRRPQTKRLVGTWG